MNVLHERPVLHNYGLLLPPEIARHVPLMVQAYRGDLRIQKRRWQPVEQKQLGEPALTHRLVGNSRAIYLFCERHRSLKAILNRFGHLSEKKISSFLQMMIDKRLMFRGKNQFLSLAIRIKRDIFL